MGGMGSGLQFASGRNGVRSSVRVGGLAPSRAHVFGRQVHEDGVNSFPNKVLKAKFAGEFADEQIWAVRDLTRRWSGLGPLTSPVKRGTPA